MGAIFNGSDADLLVNEAVVGSTPNYPVLVLIDFKSAITNANFLAMWSTSNNLAVTNNREFQIGDNGNGTGTPVFAAPVVGNNSGVASVGDHSTSVWHRLIVLATSDSSRSIALNGSAFTTETTQRIITGLNNMTIGALRRNGVIQRYNGRIANVAVWTNVNATDVVNTHRAALFDTSGGFVRPESYSPLVANLVWFDAMLSGLGATGSVGTTATNTNVTFDSGDHPTMAALSSGVKSTTNSILTSSILTHGGLAV